MSACLTLRSVLPENVAGSVYELYGYVGLHTEDSSLRCLTFWSSLLSKHQPVQTERTAAKSTQTMELTDVIKFCPKSNALPSANTHVTIKAAQSFYKILLNFCIHTSERFPVSIMSIFFMLRQLKICLSHPHPPFVLPNTILMIFAVSPSYWHCPRRVSGFDIYGCGQGLFFCVTAQWARRRVL
jgi:hypothetical protein